MCLVRFTWVRKAEVRHIGRHIGSLCDLSDHTSRDSRSPAVEGHPASRVSRRSAPVVVRADHRPSAF